MLQHVWMERRKDDDDGRDGDDVEVDVTTGGIQGGCRLWRRTRVKIEDFLQNCSLFVMVGDEGVPEYSLQMLMRR